MLVREALCWHRADGESPGKQLGSTTESLGDTSGKVCLQNRAWRAMSSKPGPRNLHSGGAAELTEVSTGKGAWEMELGKPSGTRKVSPRSQEQRPGPEETCMARPALRVMPGLSPSPVLLHPK